MRKKILAALAAASFAAPAMAASFDSSAELGARKSGAAAGLYFAVPLSGASRGQPRAGLRIQMTHDYRDARAHSAPFLRANALEFRFLGDPKPTFYVADMPMGGDKGRRNNMVGTGIVKLGILVATIVGGYVIYTAVKGDDEENCLDPNLCD